MPIPECDYYSFIVRLEIRQCAFFNFVFLLQDCFGFSRYFALSYRFWKERFYFNKKFCGIFIWIALKLENNMRKIDLKWLSPSFHENIKSLHLFRASLFSVEVFYSFWYEGICLLPVKFLLVFNFLCYCKWNLFRCHFPFACSYSVEIQLILAFQS